MGGGVMERKRREFICVKLSQSSSWDIEIVFEMCNNKTLFQLENNQFILKCKNVVEIFTLPPHL